MAKLNGPMTALLAAGALTAGACNRNGSMAPVPTQPSAAQPAPPVPDPPPPARYAVTFEATWSAATHAAPADPHFSSLIGGTHNERVAFWREGATASNGIKDMAERGRTSPLDTEIQAAVSAGTAQHILRGAAISSPSTTAFEFDISAGFPLVTLVTMVAPSPDWFIGVSGLNLMDGSTWRHEVSIPLAPWDAGTDSGVTFTSPDAVTTPRQPIFRIVTPPLGDGTTTGPLGRFTFRRIES